MFCPDCHAEYREGFVRCSDCDVPLVAELRSQEAEEVHEDFELEKVFESANPALVAIAKSILEGAEIEFFTSGEGSQIEFTVIPVRIQVPENRAAEAKSLLEDLEEGEVPPLDDEVD